MFEEALRDHTSMESRKFLSLLSGVKIDWKRILRDSLNRALDRSAELSWGKPRLSWLVNTDRLPYLPNYTEEPRLGTVIMSIDESASMSDRVVAKAIDIVCQAKNKYKKIYVIKHDVNVTWTEEYENIGPYEKKILIERRHSGGTSHRNVFKEIMRYVRSHEGDLVSAYIGITDMESDIPESQDLLPGFIPKIYLTNARSLPKGIIGKVINFN
jgi:predicted metal-dependent peptidase